MTVLLLTGCIDDTNSPTSQYRAELGRLAASLDDQSIAEVLHPETLDGELARIGLEIPGFGGYYIRDNVAVISLTNVEQLDKAGPRVLESLRANGLGKFASRAEAVPVEFTFLQLARWRLVL